MVEYGFKKYICFGFTLKNLSEVKGHNSINSGSKMVRNDLYTHLAFGDVMVRCRDGQVHEWTTKHSITSN